MPIITNVNHKENPLKPIVCDLWYNFRMFFAHFSCDSFMWHLRWFVRKSVSEILAFTINTNVMASLTFGIFRLYKNKSISSKILMKGGILNRKYHWYICKDYNLCTYMCFIPLHAYWSIDLCVWMHICMFLYVFIVNTFQNKNAKNIF